MPPLAAGSERHKIDAMTVLVVEDDWVLAEEIAQRLQHDGYRVAGPAAGVGHALKLLDGQRIDAALLDVTLGGESCVPVAEALTRHGVGFAFLTGHNREALPDRFREHPILQKPARAAHICEQLSRLLPQKTPL